MRFLRHLLDLVREFGLFAWHDRVWWILPLMLVLLAIAGLVVSTQAATPLIYALF